MKRIKKLLVVVFSILLLSGCSVFEDNSMKEINVYTTIYPFNHLVNYLYGNNAKVYSVYPSSVNVNTYKVSDKKLKEYSKSDLFVFSSSSDKERQYAAKMVNNNKNIKLIDVSMGMSVTNGEEELWLNPYNYLMMAKNVKEGLNKYINNKLVTDSINKSYEELQYEISNLDASLKEVINNANYTTIVTDNNSLNFLEKYGLEIICLDEKSDIDTAKNLIANGKIKYLYSLNDDNNEEINNFVTENNIELIKLNSLKSVDGNIEDSNEDYFSIMNDFIESINKELEK